MIILEIIFWTALGLIFYSYVFFPLILHLLAGKKKLRPLAYGPDEWPFVSVLIAAYNEEQVIGEKLESVMDTEFPADQMEILVASDASTDRTLDILRQMESTHPQIRVFSYPERKGKPEIINELAEIARGEILVISDANVMLERATLTNLLSWFKDEKTGLIDTRMVNTRIKKDGISRQEKFYIGNEVRIKQWESLLWGTMMGPFGGCYAVRKELYRPVPGNFLVDDFFINMAVLEQGKDCISHMDALVYEDASNSPAEEFRRKARISTGNFQNLARYAPLLFQGKKGLGFSFFSHKFLRWIVPFLALAMLGSSIPLASGLVLYRLLLLIQLVVLLIPVIDHILRKIHVHSVPLRFVSHFVLMNLALLAGFFRYLGGIKNNVWQPTRRNQD